MDGEPVSGLSFVLFFFCFVLFCFVLFLFSLSFTLLACENAIGFVHSHINTKRTSHNQTLHNTIKFDAYLPSMAESDLVAINETNSAVRFGKVGRAAVMQSLGNSTTLTPELLNAMELDMNGARFLDALGRPLASDDVRAALIPVPSDQLPAPMPPQVQTGLVISVQVPGATRFDGLPQPRFPNVDGAAPGSKTLLWVSFCLLFVLFLFLFCFVFF